MSVVRGNRDASPLPLGWQWSTLGEIGRYHNGRGFKKTEWEDAGRPIIRIQNLTDASKPFNHFDGEAEEQHTARPGDLLVSWAATLDVFRWTGTEAVINQHIFKVESFVDPDFHYWALRASLDALRGQTHGTAMVHITRDRFLTTPVPLPPAREQRRVVAAIESVMAMIDAAELAVATARSKAELLRKVLSERAATVPGPRKPLKELLREPLRNGHSARASEDSTGTRTLTLTAVTENSFIDSNTKLTVAEPRRVRGLWLEPGDIFVQRSNTPELVGSAALYRGEKRWAIFPDLLIRIRVGEAVSPEYLLRVLQAPSVRAVVRSKAQGISGSMPKISQSTLEELSVPLPSPLDQEAMIAEIERMENVARAAMDDAQRAGDMVPRLRRSVLRAAVSGRLVSHSPSSTRASPPLDRRIPLPPSRERT